MQYLLIFVLFASACGHTEPFVTSPSGAQGPITPPPDRQLMVDPFHSNRSGEFEWANDGSGILIFTPRPFEVLYDFPLFPDGERYDEVDNCLGLLPPGGGSMTVQICDRRLSHFHDLIDVFETAAVGEGGRLLYVESSRSSRTISPLALEADLWLGSIYEPFLSRRHLFTLYRDDNGHPTVPPDAINWLTELRWIGRDTFLAKGHNRHPDTTLTAFGIVRGAITGDTTSLTLLPGTRAINRYSPAEGGSSIIYEKPGMVLASMAISGGAERIVATIPTAPSRSISSLSCQLRLCLVLTSEAGNTVSTLWRVSVVTGQVTLERTFTEFGVPEIARLSPDGLHVVVRKSDRRLYLLPDLLP